MNDKQVAGHFTVNDRPDSLNALKHVLMERSNPSEGADKETAKKVSQLLHSISLSEAEQEAKEKAELEAAQKRGEEAGKAGQ